MDRSLVGSVPTVEADKMVEADKTVEVGKLVEANKAVEVGYFCHYVM